MPLSDACPQSHNALFNFPIDTNMHSTQLVGLENTLQSSTLVYLNSKWASPINVLAYRIILYELQVIRSRKIDPNIQEMEIRKRP